MALRFKTTAEKITREFASQNDLLFLPADAAEAIFVQQSLFDMGIRWANGDGKVSNIDKSVANGLVLQNGRLYWRGEDDDAAGYLLCQAKQLRADYMPPQEKDIPAETVADMFREMMTRLTQVEEKLARLEREIVPQEIAKPKSGPHKPILHKPPNT
jgi:hypothetical protein